MAARVARRIVTLLARRGLGPQGDPEEADPLPRNLPLLAQFYAASVHGRIATGPRTGHYQITDQLGGTSVNSASVFLLTGKVKNPTLYFMKSVISSKGQVTVPISVRRKLGLKPGTTVTFRLTPSGALLRKGSKGTHPVDRVYGKLKLTRSVNELIEETRGPEIAES